MDDRQREVLKAINERPPKLTLFSDRFRGLLEAWHNGKAELTVDDMEMVLICGNDVASFTIPHARAFSPPSVATPWSGEVNVNETSCRNGTSDAAAYPSVVEEPTDECPQSCSENSGSWVSLIDGVESLAGARDVS